MAVFSAEDPNDPSIGRPREDGTRAVDLAYGEAGTRLSAVRGGYTVIAIEAGPAVTNFPFDYTIVSVVLWIVLLTFLLGNLFWVFEMGLLSTASIKSALRSKTTAKPEQTYDLDEVQVRIITIGASDVVQRTVQSLPDELTDRHVVAEEPMEIAGATVHVVPESFRCEATKKGRALEWARKNVPCEKEYVLYLDEDTIVGELSEIPDADVVQFSERPVRTTSLVAYLSELLRMGYQLEQRAFSKLSIPLYAWGGGIAIKTDLEEEITWNHKTITEDTTFVWKAVKTGDLDFKTVPVKFYNQAPPSVLEMIKQRRRWFSGGVNNLSILPFGYRILFWTRSIAWSLTPLYPVLILVSYSTNSLVFDQYYLVVSVVLTAFLYLWSLFGAVYTRESVPMSLVLLVLTPIVAIVHSLGAFLGLVAPVRDFESTEKINQASSITDKSAYIDE